MIKKNIAAFIAIFISLLFIAAGICTGQPGAVMAKAIRICMECIGLG